MTHKRLPTAVFLGALTTVLFVLIAVVAIVLLWLRAVVETEREDNRQRAYANCQSNNENRLLVRQFADILIQVGEDDSTPQQVAQFRALVEPLTTPENCVELVNNPEKANGASR